MGRKARAAWRLRVFLRGLSAQEAPIATASRRTSLPDPASWEPDIGDVLAVLMGEGARASSWPGAAPPCERDGGPGHSREIPVRAAQLRRPAHA